MYKRVHKILYEMYYQSVGDEKKVLYVCKVMAKDNLIRLCRGCSYIQGLLQNHTKRKQKVKKTGLGGRLLVNLRKLPLWRLFWRKHRRSC